LNVAMTCGSPANSAACEIHEPGRCDILQAHQQRWREVDELRALVGAVVEDLRDREFGRADADAITDVRSQLREESYFQPRFAAARQRIHFAGDRERRIGNLQATAQRVAARCRADRSKRTVLAVEDDTWEP
jgi:hypothetical protein